MVVEAVSVAEEAAVAVLAAAAEALVAAEAMVDEVADVTLVHLHLQVDTVVLAVVETVMVVVMAADLANALDHGNFHPYSSFSNPSSAHHHEEPDPRQSTMHMIVINCPSAKKTSLPSPHLCPTFLRHFIVLLPLSYCAIHNESV